MKSLVIFCFIFSTLEPIKGKSIGNSAHSMRVPSEAKQNFTTDAQTESKSTLQINNEAATDRPKNGAKITGGPANQVQVTDSLTTEEPRNVRLPPCCKRWNPDAMNQVPIDTIPIRANPPQRPLTLIVALS
ncbi:uncharacterized protein LOC112538672 isoform X2 [Tetranychus urticae]|uniref:uncharacterized protein LOC112538672 isoform X2 n=1 Tax=Tetranychus urticae TaxID=32264 RepID=UPI000D655243|nr:uncharacterized protein LOC112538672 isoform X2 [Tetranychus urticae]